MYVFGTPVPARYIHLTLLDWVRCAAIKEKKEYLNAKLNFVYFSYQPDFEYLKISLLSLMGSVDCRYIRHIHLFEDQKAKFNDNELAELTRLCPKLIVHEVNNFSWASPESTLAEIKCFLKVAESADNADMVVKVDSDILFLKSNKLVRLLLSGIHAVGDGHHEDYKFAQGGLYMLRAQLVKDLLGVVELDDVLAVVGQNKSAGEDRAISRILQNNGQGFYLTRLMMYPTEYRRIEKLTRFNRWDFCAAHFVKDKQRMPHYKSLFNQ